MRGITPNLTNDIRSHIGSRDIGAADAYPTKSFHELVHHIARLSIRNKDFMLLYRGQGSDYRNKAGKSTLYPTIYRGASLTADNLRALFANLDRAAKELRKQIGIANLEGQDDSDKRLVLWSLLQHYEVCATPLLDFTSSIRVACSFAIHDARGEAAFIYVCGLPYTRGRISLDSEHDLVNVRLLGICPPDALRPVFQEGYLAETYEVTTDYSSKPLLDFNQRLIAKFRIPTNMAFWGAAASAIPQEELYPEEDPLLSIAGTVREFLKRAESVGPSEIGHFLELWSTLESAVMELASLYQRTPRTMKNATTVLRKAKVPDDFLGDLDDVRRIRNRVVRSPKEVSLDELLSARDRIPTLIDRIEVLYADAPAVRFEGTIDGGVWE